MICPYCGYRVSKKDVVWLLGVAGHFECHRRRQATNTRVTLTAFFMWLLILGSFIGVMVWLFFSGVGGDRFAGGGT
jgi:hypothetical protein